MKLVPGSGRVMAMVRARARATNRDGNRKAVRDGKVLGLGLWSEMAFWQGMTF